MKTVALAGTTVAAAAFVSFLVVSQARKKCEKYVREFADHRPLVNASDVEV
jgi:hypothetical protein